MDKLLISWVTFWESRLLEYSISPAGTTETFSSELKSKTQIILSKLKKKKHITQDRMETAGQTRANRRRI